MWIKVVVHNYEDGIPFVPSPTPIEMRDAKAEIWIKNGWAIRVPDPNAQVELERAEIETPEDHAESPKRERAVLKRKADE